MQNDGMVKWYMAQTFRVMAHEIKPDGTRITGDDVVHAGHLKFGCPDGCLDDHIKWRNELRKHAALRNNPNRQASDATGSDRGDRQLPDAHGVGIS